MSWIEFDGCKIKKLKKFHDLRRAMNWSVCETLGFLCSFLSEVMDVAENGEITGWTPEYLIDLSYVNIAPERVWKAMVSSGWLAEVDGKVMVADWLDFAARPLINKYSSSNKDKLMNIWVLHGKQYGYASGKRVKPVAFHNNNKDSPIYIKDSSEKKKYIKGKNGKRMKSDCKATGKRVKEFISEYCEAFKSSYGEYPLVTKKDAGIAQRLIQIPKIKIAMERFFSSTDNFVLQSRHSLSIVESQMNKLLFDGKSVQPPPKCVYDNNKPCYYDCKECTEFKKKR